VTCVNPTDNTQIIGVPIWENNQMMVGEINPISASDHLFAQYNVEIPANYDIHVVTNSRKLSKDYDVYHLPNTNALNTKGQQNIYKFGELLPNTEPPVISVSNSKFELMMTTEETSMTLRTEANSADATSVNYDIGDLTKTGYVIKDYTKNTLAEVLSVVSNLGSNKPYVSGNNLMIENKQGNHVVLVDNISNRRLRYNKYLDIYYTKER
jgi:hypothetical protein